MLSLSGEALYGLNNWFGAGITTNFNTLNLNTHHPHNCACDDRFARINILDYGIKGRIHLLPLILQTSYNRLDIYGNLEFGGHSVLYGKAMSNYDNYTKLLVGTGGGIGFNFTKSFGIFYECNYNNIYKLNHKYGLIFRI